MMLRWRNRPAIYEQEVANTRESGWANSIACVSFLGLCQVEFLPPTRSWRAARNVTNSRIYRFLKGKWASVLVFCKWLERKRLVMFDVLMIVYSNKQPGVWCFRICPQEIMDTRSWWLTTENRNWPICNSVHVCENTMKKVWAASKSSHTGSWHVIDRYCFVFCGFEAYQLQKVNHF